MRGGGVTISPDAAIENAARLMYKSKVSRLPVVDADGHLTGIISRADVLSVFDRSDHEIQSQITRDVLLEEFLVDPDAFAVTVNDGMVTLAGVPENNEVGHEIVRRVRHIPGVVAVRDRLTYFDPKG
jgi:CBS domain-containing protein